jgi:transaldolase
MTTKRRNDSPLERLHDAGVSIWLDTSSRDLLETGEFERLLRDFAVTGATSNPTIFAKAIMGSNRYDEQIRSAVADGIADPQEVFFRLGLEDVRRAADLLRPTHARSAGTDGFVSFECTPDLADDTAATIEQAAALWCRLDRDNVMIKVPATAAGIRAIEELTRRGVNVNVTLLFSLERYDQVIEAYLRGLERRANGASRCPASARSRRSSFRASTPRRSGSSRPNPRFAAASRPPTPRAPTTSGASGSPPRAGSA